MISYRAPLTQKVHATIGIDGVAPSFLKGAVCGDGSTSTKVKDFANKTRGTEHIERKIIFST